MFSVDDMLAQARADTGLSDFGEDGFREGLQRLVDGSNHGLKLSPLGAMAFPAEVHRLLVNRLRFTDDLKRHPEILDEVLDDPIIVLGMPRTGTTKLQRLLAADPAIQSLKTWQMLNPARLPGMAAGAESGAEDPRIEMGRQMVAMMAQASPGLMQSHPLAAEVPEEEIFLQIFTFRCQATYMTHPAPGFDQWIAGQSLQGTYRYMKQMLQYLQWQGGGRVGDKRRRRWVLKTPLHLGNLDLLAENFPRASYVCTHRDLREVIPSFCRLMEMFWRMKIDEIDMARIGRYTIDFWSREMQRHLRQRDMLGERIDILDLDYVRVRDEPFAVVRDVYRHAGCELTPQVEHAMRDWSARDIHGTFGNHGYSLGPYGISLDEVDAAFAEYHQRFLRGKESAAVEPPQRKAGE